MPGARVISLVAGVWLFISAFVWHHTQVEFFNTWIAGILVAVLAVTGMRLRGARYVNTLLAIWIFLSAFFFPHTMATAWNNALVGALIFAMSLLSGRSDYPAHLTGPGKRATLPPEQASTVNA